jgi:hypothetical protein
MEITEFTKFAVRDQAIAKLRCSVFKGKTRELCFEPLSITHPDQRSGADASAI